MKSNILKFVFLLLLLTEIKSNEADDGFTVEYNSGEEPEDETETTREPVGEANTEILENGDDPDVTALQNEVESDLLKKFRVISEEVERYKKEYEFCLDRVLDKNWRADTINECVGENLIKVIIDMKYITDKILLDHEYKVQNVFNTLCYAEVKLDTKYLFACSEMENDTIDFVWNGLDFPKLLENNKVKYQLDLDQMAFGFYEKIVEALKKYRKDFFELLNEMYSHKDLIQIRMREFINKRQEYVNSLKIRGPETVTHEIEITELVQSDTPEQQDARKLKISNLYQHKNDFQVKDHTQILTKAQGIDDYRGDRVKNQKFDYLTMLKHRYKIGAELKDPRFKGNRKLFHKKMRMINLLQREGLDKVSLPKKSINVHAKRKEGYTFRNKRKFFKE